MCGIAGIIDLSGISADDRHRLNRMAHNLRHRGPDDSDVYSDGTAALGHTRLSIIDLSTGRQPLSNEDGTVWIVFNGEIYNFAELRAELEAKGHTFRTASDTEVIVHLYEEKGVECLHRLRGMFAFAIWDTPRQRLFLARDRLGEKPLVYAAIGNRIAFASEINALLELPHVSREIDVQALDSYFCCGYIPHPRSVFRDVRKLPPAHYAVFEGGRLDVRRYWTPQTEEMFGSEQEYVERVRAELTEATRLRLVSDVPLGAFLSGGLDSTIIVGLMQRLLPRPAQTFSIRFSEWDYDEGPYARLAAERLEADHHEFVVQANCLEILPELIWHYGEPFADSSAVPTYYVSKLTRQAVTVALTGDGGDELFGGYNRYHVLQRMARFDAVPRGLRDLGRLHAWKRMLGTARPGSLRQRAETFLELVALSPRDRAARIANVGMGARLRAELYLPEFAAAAEGTDPLGFIREAFDSFAGRDSVTRTMLADQLTYLPGDILTKVDIASMANGLETRPPFLDHRVVELAARMPLSFKLRGRQGKYILKKAFADFVPREILDRKKMGFVVPVKQWFRHELREYTRQILLDPMTLGRGYFYAAVVERLVNEHLTGAKDHTRRLWLLLCFELWHRQFIDASRGGGTRAA